jgi:hypothetical protein
MLGLTDAPDQIAVRVFAPIPQPIDWSCHVEIDWPDRLWAHDAVGIDSVQAVDLALRMIGTTLYTSDFHATGRLVWLKKGAGYGFPVPNAIRDLLVGEDRQWFG